MRMNKEIETFCNNHSDYCESENYHDECGKAEELAETLLRHHVKADTVLEILHEYFGDAGQDNEDE